MNRVKGIRQFGIAAATVATIAVGMATDASAVTFANGDLIFALYGNDREYVLNMGQSSTVLADNAVTMFTIGQNFVNEANTPIAPELVPRNLKWSIYSHLLDEDGNPLSVKFSSAKALDQVTDQEKSTTNAFLESVAGRGVGFQGLNQSRNVNPDVIPRTNTASFTSKFGVTGSLGGIAWGTLGQLDSSRPIFMATFDPKVYSTVGSATLSGILQDGSLNLTVEGLKVSPPPPPGGAVPEPSSILLLGTGLIGVFGAARRARATNRS